VLVVALGAVLWVLGDWVIEKSSLSNFGWVAYAPLTSSVPTRLGQPSWVRVVFWLGLIAVWTVGALLLLRDRKPKVEPPTGHHLGDDPTTTP
jgi:hypothetical protein